MVDVIRIPGEVRTDFGKGYARRIRANDQIPAVIYGHGHDPIHVSLPGHEMMLVARNANAVIEVLADGEHLCMLKDIQRHPIRPEILHIDLLTVKRGEKVEVDVPLVVTGEVAPGTMYNQEESTVTVLVDALKVPEQFELSVEGREPEQHLYASDINLPSGVELVTDAEMLVVNVAEPIEQDLGEEPEAEGEEAEGEEGEAAEAEASEESSDDE
ncbi:MULTISPECIES: 50S ribosomal protein L25/general stress protein Ctc [Kocuria]|uniref:Large ribosomal subunit protein bL25 n=1 Tax=Kocuria subflava TaxID=1736139 RepID=A0A846TRH5_9MICC|nr:MULTISPECIES: 50S ribosomal protein L25/general stress protein Ctc [Kocuria]NKE09429.1 50S ribosomal protein L25/general stress protein Ctc [Kocuria subflava]